MKRLILLSISLICFFCAFSQSDKKEDYNLSIVKGKIQQQNNQYYFVIPTTLTNQTNDTLKYFSMSCSWQDFYSIDNNKLQIESELCDKNSPIILLLAPKQNRTVEIKLLINQNMDSAELKFRIGLNLIKASDTSNNFDFDFYEFKKKTNIIWSNYISR